MAMSDLNIICYQLCSWNIRGPQKPAKRTAVLSFLKKEDVSIAFLQKTHLDDKNNAKLQRSWVGQVFATSYSFFSSVAILIIKELAFRFLDCFKDSQGRYVIVKGILAGKEVTIMNLYCTPAYSPDFLFKAFAVFIEWASGDSFVDRDFCCHLNPSLYKLPPDISPPYKQARVLTNIWHDIEYSDVWRQLHPTDSEFTFFSALHKSCTRIHYIFIPSSKVSLALSCSIGNIVLSDHAPLNLVYSLAEERV